MEDRSGHPRPVGIGMLAALLDRFSAGARPPVTIEQIDAAQEQLGVALPPRLIEFYSQSNGLVIDEYGLTLNDLANGAEYAEAISRFELAAFLGLFPLSESNDSNPYCIACKQPLLGRIIQLSHDDAPRLAYPDLDSFATAILAVVTLDDWLIDDIEPGYAADHSDRTPDDDLAADALIAGDCPDVDNALKIAISLWSAGRVQSIIDLLEHESIWVREDAARELGQLHNPQALEPLQRLAAKGDRQDNREAARAVSALQKRKDGL